MAGRLFPARTDNRFEGRPSSLWLLGLLLALKLVIALNSIVNGASVAAGADGIPIESFGPAGAREVVRLFALAALGQLMLALVALAVLIRWRALVPFVYLILLGEQLARRVIAAAHAAGGAGGSPIGTFITYGILALLALGFLLSLLPVRQQAEVEDPVSA